MTEQHWVHRYQLLLSPSPGWTFQGTGAHVPSLPSYWLNNNLLIFVLKSVRTWLRASRENGRHRAATNIRPTRLPNSGE